MNLRESRWREPALLLLVCLAFLIANSGAYDGYFHDDDLDNLAANSIGGWQGPVHDITTWKLIPVYRPLGALTMFAAGRVFGLNFPWYVAAIQLMHLANLLLLWLFLRRLGLPLAARFCGALFYAFHFAVIAAYWQPMFCFDVICALLCLLTLVLHQRGHLLLALLTYWLAVKAKEPALCFPAALLAYEYWLGQRRWLRVAPSLIVAFVFGVQGLVRGPYMPGDYTAHFEISSVLRCLGFYLQWLGGIPLAGLLFAGLALYMRTPLAKVGLVTAATLLMPMLILPGRLNSVYWYMPLLGVALIIAEAARRWPRAVLASFLLWLPWNNHFLRIYRRHELPIARNNRLYVDNLRYAWEHHFGPRPHAIIIDGVPNTMARYGVDGAIRLISRDEDPKLIEWDTPAAQTALADDATVQITWNQLDRQMRLATPSHVPPAGYIDFGHQAPGLALRDGWHPEDGHLRWSYPSAHVRLPQTSSRFIVKGAPQEEQIRMAGGKVDVELLVDGVSAGTQQARKAGGQTLVWNVSGPLGATRDIELKVTPAYHPSNGDTRALGLPVTAIGFVPEPSTSGAGETPRSAPGSTAR